jgi:hypothetical protein
MDWPLGGKSSCTAGWYQFGQGLYNMIERYRNSPIMNDAVPSVYKPAYFEFGQEIPFPAPTRRLRMPRLRGAKKLKKRFPSEIQNVYVEEHSPRTIGPANSGVPGEVWFVDLLASRGTTCAGDAVVQSNEM